MCRFQKYFSQRAALLGVALLMLLLLGSPTNATAFALYGMDAKVGVIDPEGVDGTLAVGAGLNFQQADSHVHLVPNAMFWSENGLSDVNTNFDASYHFEPAGRVSPYLGAGLGMLLAPRRGSELRGQLTGSATKAGALVAEKYRSASGLAMKTVDGLAACAQQIQTWVRREVPDTWSKGAPSTGEVTRVG